MKKIIILFSFLTFIILSYTAIGQDSTEIHWAKHFQKAIENRPNPKIFSEKEAWKVLTGDTSSSKDFTIHSFEYRNYEFMMKINTSVENYTRSSTASIDEWWYTNTKSFTEGDWVINWPFLMAIASASVFILFIVYLVKNWKKLFP